MFNRNTALLTLLPLLGACTVGLAGSEDQDTAPTPPVPEQVVAVAAPNQDVMAAYLRPEDNCYWYLHAGPVETTPLPLKTTDGRAICIRQEEEQSS
ncbi:hypothetical protein FTO60_02245 [Octadecabacter sp. SW4]|uniref:hypothetical protein n=1 Tax=Octadecabacter sp. SW4 TaxID=2602067 RepID=UPI0011C1D972|nr:hypothetical protein [Octadecabacter sp. SW4]QEE34630.1 hypothetical protein FTO60_02245 [Octadecabacter sp. SW4]